MRDVLPVMPAITKTLNSKDRNLEMPVLQADPSRDGHQYQPETGPFLKVLTISFLSLPHQSSHPSQCLSPHSHRIAPFLYSPVTLLLTFTLSGQESHCFPGGQHSHIHLLCALARLWIRLSASGALIHIPPNIFYFPFMDPIAESCCINFSYCPPSCGGSWLTRRYIHKGNVCAMRIWVIIFMFTQVTVFHSEYIILHSCTSYCTPLEYIFGVKRICLSFSSSSLMYSLDLISVVNSDAIESFCWLYWGIIDKS